MREFYSASQLPAASQGARGVRTLRNLFVAVLALSTVAPVWAQRYKTIKAMPRREAQSLERNVRAAVQNPSGFGASAEDVKTYFTRYYFPIMTSTDAANLGELGDRREDLFKRYLRNISNPSSQAELTKLCLGVSRVLAIENYHPAVRYNATLIIGNLDSRNAANGAPPVPLPDGTALLLDLLEKETMERKGTQHAVHPVVKTGALVGLERHARYGIEARYADRLTKAMLAVINEEDRPEEIDEDVHVWKKCQAVAVLVQQFKASPNAQLQDTLNELIAGDKFDLDDRCYITKMMLLPAYDQAQDINAASTLQALSKITKDVLEAEAKEAKEFEDAMLDGTEGFSAGRGGGRLFGGGGFRGGGNGEEALTFERRRLLSRLRAIQEGGDSVAKGLPEETKAKVTSLIEAMKTLRAETADDDTTDLRIVELVVTTKADVDRLIESWGGGDAAAEPAEADFS